MLSSIVFASLNSARGKAVNAAALETARGVLPIASDCRGNGYYFVTLVDSNSGGGQICTQGWGSTVPWPRLPTGWQWITGYPGAAPADSHYILRKEVGEEVYYIGCGEWGCQETGPHAPVP